MTERAISTRDFDAVIFDLDGVITHTAAVHASAWKRVFDKYLGPRAVRNGEPFQQFDLDDDYTRYVDGKPRYDGVRSFLASRGIELSEGHPKDGPEVETVCGLGNRKNRLYNEMLSEAGVEVFEDAVQQLHRWRAMGLKTAIVSSSKNCQLVLQAAGLSEFFEVRVDGMEASRLELRGKPAPDMFLKAAELLGVEARRAVVFEDAVSGVQAAAAGGFGWVVGVDRIGARQALLENGADTVVADLREIKTEGLKP